ncbi:MAG: hypothetical protein WBP93_18435 [Pyrinomonadaceae bacterium]
MKTINFKPLRIGNVTGFAVLVVFGLAMWIDHQLGNDRHHFYTADLATAVIMGALLVNQLVVQPFVTRLFAPKAKPQYRGILQGGIQIQDSDFDLFIPEIYSADPLVEISYDRKGRYEVTF